MPGGPGVPSGSDLLAGLRGRVLLVVLGLAGIGYGLWQLVVAAPSATRPLASGLWLAGVLVVHDGVLAPIAVVVGVLAVRLLPAPIRRVVAIGLFIGVCVVTVALPALLTPGVAGNPSATPRDYGRGLTVALLVDGVLVAFVIAIQWAARRRRSVS